MSNLRGRIRRAGKRASRAVLIAIGVIYFLIDVLVLSLIRPLRRRLMAWHALQGLRLWVGGLNRYVALVLLVVPWLLLEPLKPLGVVLFAHRHHLAAVLLIAGSEVLKLVFFEQVFDMAKPKLLSFRWFAWGYHHWQEVQSYLHALPAWQQMTRWYRTSRAWIGRWVESRLRSFTRP